MVAQASFLHRKGAITGFLACFMHLSCGKLLLRGCEFYAIDVRLLSKTAGRDLLEVLCSAIESHAAQTQQKRTTEVSSYMRIDSRKPKAAALSAALTVALLAGAGATDAHAATLSDTVGSTPSEATLVQPVDYRGDGYGSMQEWNASMEAMRDSLEMRAQIIMNMYGDYATDNERAVLQGCIDGAGSLLTMGEVDTKSTELDELRTALENAKREALEAAAAEAEAAEAVQASYYNAGSGLSYTSAAYYANGSGLTRSSGVNNYNGRRETYYSSNVLYHHRTGEWTQDSEGFWRDSDGYYVVAAGDKAQGSTFTGSKGECKVYDSGCAAGTTDYYTGW
jgi:hypothetical protein